VSVADEPKTLMISSMYHGACSERDRKSQNVDDIIDVSRCVFRKGPEIAEAINRGSRAGVADSCTCITLLMVRRREKANPDAHVVTLYA